MDAQLLTADFFTLFGFPRAYEIDALALRDEYRALQTQIHPDRFAHGSDQEKRLAVQCAAHVNEAFATLKDPVRRARYLLELVGANWTDESATLNDTVFLMEQMELRERLEELSEDEAPAFMADVDQRMAALQRNFGELWSKDNDASRRQAQTVVRKMQFLSKLRADADARF